MKNLMKQPGSRQAGGMKNGIMDILPKPKAFGHRLMPAIAVSCFVSTSNPLLGAGAESLQREVTVQAKAVDLITPVMTNQEPGPGRRVRQVAEIVSQVEQGAIPIGGFISPGERAVATEAAKIPRARMIKLLPWGLKRYKPSGAVATRWLAEGRSLILTGFPDDEPAACCRTSCFKNNEWVRQIASL